MAKTIVRHGISAVLIIVHILLMITPGTTQTVDMWPPGFYELVDHNGHAIKDAVAWCIQDRDPYYWITNKHCVLDETGKPAKYVHVVRSDDKQFIRVHVEHYHPTQDIAILHATKPPPFKVDAIETTKEPLQSGDHVFTWVRVGDRTFSRCDGEAVELVRMRDGKQGWVTTLHSFPGASGTPIFNADGMCIGVNTGVLVDRAGNDFQFTVPILDVLDLFYTKSTH